MFLRNNYLLWTLQILLAALYFFAGGFKIVAAPEQMVASPADPIPTPEVVLFLRTIGAFEVLGAFGLILPGITGIRRHLTAIAAGCLAFIMLGAVVTSAVMMGAQAAIVPFVVGILDLVVFYGRRGWGKV